MTHANGNGTGSHPFYPSSAFEPVWSYYKCNKCRRVIVFVATSRGDYPPHFKCTTMPGFSMVDGKPCEGLLMRNEERKMRDWPVYARHEPDAEWYKPGNDEMRKIKRAAPKLWAYITQGGLIARGPKGSFPWPLAGPRVPHVPITPDPAPPGAPICPDCGNVLINGACPIHGDPNNNSDPNGVLLK